MGPVDIAILAVIAVLFVLCVRSFRRSEGECSDCGSASSCSAHATGAPCPAADNMLRHARSALDDASGNRGETHM